VSLFHWTHVAVIFDGRKVAVFLDGALEGEKRINARASPSPYPFYVGRLPPGVSATSKPTAAFLAVHLTLLFSFRLFFIFFFVACGSYDDVCMCVCSVRECSCER
jgi:hypothetical protein